MQFLRSEEHLVSEAKYLAAFSVLWVVSSPVLAAVPGDEVALKPGTRLAQTVAGETTVRAPRAGRVRAAAQGWLLIAEDDEALGWVPDASAKPLRRGDVRDGDFLRRAPRAQAKRRGYVGVGELVVVEKSRGDWLFVRTEDTERGWLPTSAVSLRETRAKSPQRKTLRSGTKLRREPSLRAALKRVFRQPTNVEIWLNRDGWAFATTERGRFGWVPVSALGPRVTGPPPPELVKTQTTQADESSTYLRSSAAFVYPLSGSQDAARYQITIEAASLKALGSRFRAGAAMYAKMQRVTYSSDGLGMTRDLSEIDLAAAAAVRLGGDVWLQGDLGYALGAGVRYGREVSLDSSEKGPLVRGIIMAPITPRWFVLGLGSLTFYEDFEGNSSQLWLGVLVNVLKLSERWGAVFVAEHVAVSGTSQITLQGGLEFKLLKKLSLAGSFQRSTGDGAAEHSLQFGFVANL